MVGFAVMSYKENGIGGLVSQGLGTSMLQMPNILRNPRTWIPPTLAAAITGPIATCLFHLEMNGPAVSSGMGTCGLVGQIGVYTGWVEAARSSPPLTGRHGAGLFHSARCAQRHLLRGAAEEGLDQRGRSEIVSKEASPRGKLSANRLMRAGLPLLPINGL